MLKKKLFFALVGAFFTFNGIAFAQTSPQGRVVSNIEQQMNLAIQKAEADVQEKFKKATSREIVPLWADKVALENAILQLEVKKTLVNNFTGTPSLNNPVIQVKLLEILNNPNITESDLAGLQNLVNQEKLKKRNAPSTIPTPTPTTPSAPQPAPTSR